MLTLFLLTALDLSPSSKPVEVSQNGLLLALSIERGQVRGGREKLTVQAELKNVGTQPLRVVWRPSGAQPLSLFADKVDHALPPGDSLSARMGWLELKPGTSVMEKTTIILPVGTHELSWQYSVDKGPYGRPLENCWTGILTTPPLIFRVP
ncbi:MAG: hypothetical protein HYV97_01125 [Bdellovibrio sp.]|nr:hypothetical protein [Bdellovibrio sp.]